MKVKFVVYRCWYSSDQGDFPNTHFSDIRVFGKEEESSARSYYAELKKKDQSWSCGSDLATFMTLEDNQESFALTGYFSDEDSNS